MTPRPAALLVLAAGCFYVTEQERLARWDLDGDGLERPEDCDDGDPAVGAASTFYGDADEDGHGAEGDTTTACAAPAGYVAAAGDCDDRDPSAHPGAPEACDEVDDDCDGEVDEDLATATWFPDDDGDGYGVEEGSVERCGPPEGYAEVSGDCDDGDEAIHPGAVEACNDLDDDCDGWPDEEDPAFEPPSWYEDGDADGYGSGVLLAVACDPIAGAATNDEDCDDALATVFPGAEELCNAVDDDCDGAVDAGATDMRQYYEDADGDGYGDPNAPVDACPPDPPLTAPPGLAANASDCDDTRATVHPAADECIDGLDNNCNNLTDESGC